LKILEEAAMGKAIVSTPLGAEGLELSHGSEILLASSAREFAGATARLLNDAAARQEMGQAARRKVEREYGLPALRASLRPVFAGMENRADKRKEVADDVAVV
jgi:glycosyltransferase involved in cell wall biosynthesis